jgi:proteasome alpha subunit
MTMPYYVAPEQVMKDRAEYAQKGIARGRSLVAALYGNGVLIVAENPSRTLHKVSEIYDRVAFAGAGRYNEFDQLRVAGVRHADTKGYAYSREDVDARSLANLYAQFLGQVFTHEMKPLEVEILVAELDANGDDHQLYHIAYDGTVVDEVDFTVLGGDSATINDRLSASYRTGWPLAEAVRNCVAALAGPERTLEPADLEAAILEQGNGRRAFKRLSNEDLAGLMAPPDAATVGASTTTGARTDGDVPASTQADQVTEASDATGGGEPTDNAGRQADGDSGASPEPPAVPGADNV